MADGWGASDWGTPASANGAGDGGKPRGKGCYNCNEEGHMSKDCPNPPKERKTGCFNCKEEGHMSKDCPNPKAERKIECRKCGEEGHMSRECPQNGGDGERKKGCFKCGDEGHISRECPQNGGDGEKKSGCFKCGEEGHISRECPKNEGPPPDHYKPEEEAEDQLYEHGISSGINFAKYSEIQVKVSGENPPPPIKDFEESGLRPLLLENIKKSHYTKPTPVQRYAIPMIRAGRDLMACAQTGSGKTAAFLLPVLHKLLEDGVEAHACMTPQEPEVVVIAPTRELAIQIKDEARKFATGSMIKSVVVYGGTSVMFQSDQLTSKGVNVLIATPGRLLDFVEKGKVSFGKLRFLILDEADRMLDMGFMPDVQRMVSNANMPKKGERQTLMFSATFPQEVQEVAREFLDNYLFLAVGIVGGACTDVAQTFHQVGKFEKREKLMEILKETPAESKDKTLVFVEAKKTADFLATFLSQNQLSTTSIHGDRLQREREQALNDFKTGKHPILVATAVAARGLDIRNVSHVINFDMPKSIDEYVHRIGRTGRVGNVGRATSFFDSQSDNEIAQPLVKVLTDSQQDVPDFLVEAASGGYGGAAYSGGGAFGGSDIRGGAAATEEVW